MLIDHRHRIGDAHRAEGEERRQEAMHRHKVSTYSRDVQDQP